MSHAFDVPDLPVWIVENRVDDVTGSIIVEGNCKESDQIKKEADEIVPLLRKLEMEVLAKTSTSVAKDTGSCSKDPKPIPSFWLARLLLGACCEAYASYRCNLICVPGNRPKRKRDVREVSRLYKDSCLAAVWTSVHAQHAHDLLIGSSSVTTPCLHSVPSELCELDLSDLYAHRTCTRSLNSKDSIHMLSLMTRCTNPGSRGWDSVVKTSLEKSDGTRRICAYAATISFSGMHSAIHPTVRPHWKQRMHILSVVYPILQTSSMSSIMCSCSVEFKECVRRMTYNCISSAYAMVAALSHLEHPVSILQHGGNQLPNPGLEASATAFVRAGKAIAEPSPQRDALLCIQRAFKHQQLLRSTSEDGTESNQLLTWNPSYLGKGTPSVHQKVPAVSIASDVWAIAFRCNFIPFWTHSSSCQLRASRLDPVQYKAIHRLNSATQLTLLLSDEERMDMQKLALSTKSAGLMTLEEVSTLLKIPGVRGSSCNGGAKGPVDSVRAIGEAGGKNAAKILTFCRTAWISEEILIYNLGETTARKQATALLKRLLVNEVHGELADDENPLDFLHMVPDHSKNLCVCIECKRVANAFASDGGTKFKSSFNEIGTSGSMMSIDPETGHTQIRCAKRSSASLRTAVAFEEEAGLRAVECDACDDIAITKMISDTTTGSESGASARARRDSKSALEQRVASVACGNEPMLTIPIVGRAIRIYGEWYALCSFCACFVRFWPSNRVDNEICCMRCDYKLLHRNQKQPSNARDAALQEVPQCRYCGKRDPQRTGARWKLVKAPLDATGRNASLPPPLRTVHFCPTHFKPWIPQCLKTMPMRIILSHIVFGAKPCYGAETEKRVRDTQKNQPSKKRRITKKGVS